MVELWGDEKEPTIFSNAGRCPLSKWKTEAEELEKQRSWILQDCNYARSASTFILVENGTSKSQKGPFFECPLGLVCSAPFLFPCLPRHHSITIAPSSSLHVLFEARDYRDKGVIGGSSRRIRPSSFSAGTVCVHIDPEGRRAIARWVVLHVIDFLCIQIRWQCCILFESRWVHGEVLILAISSSNLSFSAWSKDPVALIYDLASSSHL